MNLFIQHLIPVYQLKESPTTAQGNYAQQISNSSSYIQLQLVVKPRYHQEGKQFGDLKDTDFTIFQQKQAPLFAV